mgnify:CR=1 FL=1
MRSYFDGEVANVYDEAVAAKRSEALKTRFRSDIEARCGRAEEVARRRPRHEHPDPGRRQALRRASPRWIARISTSRDGELFTLLGPSGCGKTTLLRLLGRVLHQPDAGQIRFGERVVNRLPPYERNIGMVFQNYALWPHMTVGANIIATACACASSAPEEISRAARGGLRKVNLIGLRARYPGQLSGRPAAAGGAGARRSC